MCIRDSYFNNVSYNARGLNFINGPPESRDNVFYLNIFDNDVNFYSLPSDVNIWNSGREFRYIYSYNGKNFTSPLGNYWNDYEGQDEDENGVGDTEYTIYGSNTDSYPLINKTDVYEIIWEPRVIIYSPGSTAYATSEIWLNVSADREIVQWNYSLDDGQSQEFTPNTTITVGDGSHTLTVYATDAEGYTGSSSVDFTVDTGPPGPVENLTFYSGSDWIRWVWDNPEDEDFACVEIYLNGSYKTCSPLNYYEIKCTTGDTYLIQLKPRDLLNNVRTDSQDLLGYTTTSSPISYVNSTHWWYEGGMAVANSTPLSDAVLHSEASSTIYCLLYTSPSPRDLSTSRMPSSA